MAYALRFTVPQKVGYIVQGKKRCGDKHCACYTKNQRHSYFGLKYREYDEVKGSIVQRITYLKAIDVPKVQAELEQVKGESLLWKVGDESVIKLVMRFPHLSQPELHRKTANSKDLPKEDWILSDYRHKPIIEPMVFDKAQRKLQESADKVTLNRRKKQPDSRLYLLSGLIKCGYCCHGDESKMLSYHGTSKKDKSSYQYICGGKTSSKHSTTCPVLPVPALQFEEYIINFVKDLLNDPQSTYNYQLKLQSNKAKVKNLKAEREKYRAQANMFPSRLDNLSRQHEIGELSEDDLVERRQAIFDEEKAITKRTAEIDRILGQQELSEGYIKTFQYYAKKYRKGLEDAQSHPDDVFTLLHSLIDRIVVYSRPVNRELDVISGKPKDGQQMPHEIKIEMKLPQDIIASMAEAKFGVKTGLLSHGRDSRLARFTRSLD